MQRSVERGLSPSDLVRLGRAHDRDDWVAAGVFARQYEQVSALREAESYDPAELIRAASALLRTDPQASADVRARHAFVVVDEYQDTDPAQEELLALIAGSRDLLAVGDPDQSIYAFRGADADGIRRFPDRFRSADGKPAPVIALSVSRRSGGDLLDATRRVADRLPGPARHRALVAEPSLPAGRVEVHVLAGPSAHAAYVTNRLRQAHLLDGVAWRQMAVLVRGSAQLPVLRRALQAGGVPVAVRAEEQALVAVPVVRALLLVLEVATGRLSLSAEADAESAANVAHELVTGPLGGADPLGLRRLRQELRRLELSAGGGRSSSVVLAEVLGDPADLAAIERRTAAPALRVARVLAAAREAVATGASAETALWAVWKACALERRWSELALSGGLGSAAADRDLDAVVALFDAAARFADRLPKAGPEVFLDHLLGQQIPGDTLAPRAPEGSGVHLMTAHAAKGLEFDVVVVAGVQEGSWPDLRMRGSLFGTQQLLDVVSGVTDAEAPVAAAQTVALRLAEERRLFYVAATRARRLLVVTAVRDDEEQPSRFLDELVPPEADERPATRVPRGLDLASVVAELRSVACSPATPAGDPRRDAAVAHLARLAAAGVRGADPGEWYGLVPISDDAPLAYDEETVRLSPSKLESFDRCPLRWLLESAGGTTGDSSAQGIGTLVHALAQQAAEEGLDDDQLRERFAAAIERIDLGSGWFAKRQRDRAAQMIEKLAAWLHDNPRQLVAAEEPFEIVLGRALLKGRVDRLERDGDNRLVVVDLKTGKHAPPKSDLAELPQLGAYQLAVAEGAFDAVAGAPGEPGGAELVQLGGTQVKAALRNQPALEVGPDGASWAHELVQRCAEGMAAAVFDAVENDMCRSCALRSCCPVWPDGRQVTS